MLCQLYFDVIASEVKQSMIASDDSLRNDDATNLS